MSLLPIFENYDLFINEHKEEFSTPSEVARLMNDEGMHTAYVAALTEGMTPGARTAVTGVLERQRMMILNEAANVGASGFVSGWTVMS